MSPALRMRAAGGVSGESARDSVAGPGPACQALPNGRSSQAVSKGAGISICLAPGLEDERWPLKRPQKLRRCEIWTPPGL